MIAGPLGGPQSGPAKPRHLPEVPLRRPALQRDVSLALSLADRAYVIEGGRIVAQGTAAEIANDPNRARAYLGGH